MRAVDRTAVIVVGLGLMVPGPIRAGDADEAALLVDIRAAQREGDPAAEASRCQQVLAILPDSRTSRMCRARLAQLEPRADADGSYSGLARLQAVRSGALPASVGPAEVIAIAQAPGTRPALRHDAWIWLARHHLVQRDDPAAALEWTQPLWRAWQDGELLDDQADVAADAHARALARLGRVAEAQAVEETRQPTRSVRPREGVPAELERRLRDRLRTAAAFTLALYGLVSMPLAGLALQRRGVGRPHGVLPMLVSGLGAFGYALGWQSEAAHTVGWVVLWALLSHLLTAQASGCVSGPRGRVAVGLLGALGFLAGALLILEHLDQLSLVL